MSFVDLHGDPPVVRIFATTQSADFASPWQTRRPRTTSGSGVVVGDPPRVLTGAHVVAGATFVQVQRAADPHKTTARVHALSHDSDLALLEVDDPDFLREIEPAQIGHLPDLRDHVAVVGFPKGGEELSITEGVVSRIEVTRYSHSRRLLLAVTVDAAINDGNSGGPVYLDDKVIGIAFQSMHEGENIGEVVPSVLIRRFLAQADAPPPADGRPLCVHVPWMGVLSQGLENPALRAAQGLTATESGARIRAVAEGSSAWGQILPGDAVLAIDGHRLADNQTVIYRDRHRTWYPVLFCEHQVGDVVPVDIVRDGQRRRVELELKPACQLVPRLDTRVEPSWFVFGGLVFQVLTLDYLDTWRDWRREAPRELVELYYRGLRTPERQEIIVISQILSDAINAGYEAIETEVVERVDGVVPRDLAHMVRLADEGRGALDLETSFGHRVVIDRAEARARDPDIRARYRVPADRSPDLR